MDRREFLKATGGLAAAAALPPLAASGPGASKDQFVSSSSWGTVEDLVGYAADGEIRVRKTEDGTWFAAVTPGSARTS